MDDLPAIFGHTLLSDNLALAYGLGLCPCLGLCGGMRAVVRLGLAITLAMVLMALAAWLLDTYVLVRAPYLRLVALVAVLAVLAQGVERIIGGIGPGPVRTLGMPLVTAHCAVLGLALLAGERGYGLLQGLVFALGAGLGVTLVAVIMAGLRAEAEFLETPAVARGTVLQLLIAAILSLVFLGFGGLFQ